MILIDHKLTVTRSLIGLLCCMSGIEGVACEDIAKTRVATCILVNNAAIVKNEPNKWPFWNANQGQILTRDVKSSVLLVRIFEEKDGSPDQGRYKKLSVQLPPLLKNSSIFPSAQYTTNYYVEGSSGFFSKKAYLYAVSIPIYLKVLQHKNHYSLRVDERFDVVSASDGSVKRAEISVDCSLRQKNLNSLSSWEGGRKTSWDSFSP